MQGNLDMLTLSLAKPVSPEALSATRSAAGSALDAGALVLAIDVNDVGILDSQVISTLVAILRDARARGAAVELRAARKNILDTLRITGLDKVFIVREPADGSVSLPTPPVRAAARLRPGRLVASVAAGAFAAASLLGAHDSRPPSPTGLSKPAAAGATREEAR